MLVAFTETGSTARFVSKARPHVPILAFCPNETTRRRLALYWGVVPQSIEPMHDADAMVERANAFVLSPTAWVRRATRSSRSSARRSASAARPIRSASECSNSARAVTRSHFSRTRRAPTQSLVPAHGHQPKPKWGAFARKRGLSA